MQPVSKTSRFPLLPSGSLPALALLFLATTTILPGCETKPTPSGAPAPKREPIPVTTASPLPANFPLLVETVGTLFGQEESTVSAKVEGRVIAVHADLGDHVLPDQPLASLDPTDFQLIIDQRRSALTEVLAKLGLPELPTGDFDPATVPTVQRAQVQQANAKARLDRARQLFDEVPPLISTQDFADIETQLAVAVRDHDVAVLDARATLATARARQADVASAQQQLADTTLRAPPPPTPSSPAATSPAAAGTAPLKWSVARRMANLGDLARPGSPMFQLVIDDPVKLRAASPERFSSLIRVGQPADITVDGSDQPHRGTISRVSPVVDRDSRTFEVEITLPNPSRQLRPGSFARAKITVGSRDDVVSLPASALQQFAGVTRVFSITPDGKAKAHTIQLLSQNKDTIQLTASALDGATSIIISNVSKLADAVPVSQSASSTQP
jgi:multidrug efflux pump subunit AcrA (membrane-fusion protein)